MITRQEIIDIGQYNKTHGVDGEISASLVCGADDLAGFSTLISEMDGILVPFFVESMRRKNDHSVLLRISGVDSERAARRLVNKRIYALRSEMADDDEVGCDFFVGFTVVDAAGERIGEIVDFDDTTENALFVVEEAGKQFYIPVSEDYIVEIDEAGRTVAMDLPQGIVDVQIN